MAWRLAKGLERLRQQVNGRYPNRGKAADGTIGDLAHSKRASDHNPVRGIVHALDLTNSPGKGYDAHSHADRIRQSRDVRVKYIISNRRITSAKYGWQWSRYGGSNPHSGHVHYSIHANPHADNSKDWKL